MAYEEEDFLLISGIQHFQFCKRQWALIHVEQQWEENVLTVEGQYLHQKAVSPSSGRSVVGGRKSWLIRVNDVL